MKFFEQKSCALCHKSVKWWNVQSCTQCGRALCGQHALTSRRPHSTVLFVTCRYCVYRNNIAQQPVNNPAPPNHIPIVLK